MSLYYAFGSPEKGRDEGGFVQRAGQAVPHEVVGMAGFNQNIFVGTGGADPAKLKDGWNTVDDEENFCISNPGPGLRASARRFND